MAQITVLIADDHALLREGLAALLALADDIQVVGEAADGCEALRLAAALQPHILLLDLSMPGLSGLEVLGHMRTRSPRTKVLIFSGFLEDEFLIEAIEQGAKGYLQKTASYKDVATAIRATHAGEIWVGRKMLTLLLERLLGELDDLRRPLAGMQQHLTDREREVVAKVMEGMTNKEVAAHLGISEKTVKTHVSHIFQKLHISRRLQLHLYRIRGQSD